MSDNAGNTKQGTGARYTIMSAIVLTAAACLICATSDGIRNNYGIMLQGIIKNSGVDYASVSLVLAVSQLFYGMIQPVFGLLAERKSNILVLLIGAALTFGGLMLLPHCRSTIALMGVLGLLMPAGTGAISYGILLGSISPKIPPHTASLVSGILTACSGVGNAALSPVIQSLLAKGGISAAATALAVPVAVLVPLCFYVGRRPKGYAPVPKTEQGHFGDALSDRTYRLLMLAFFTCGFHMALISNHLPSQITTYGITAQTSAWAFSLYGIVTMGGSVLSGWITDRFNMKNVAGVYFGSRTFITLFFLMSSKSAPAVFVYAAFLGLTGAATVPPVSGLISRRFGAGRIASLYGFVFFIHQIGGFLGAWLGGVCYQYTGSYVPIWTADMVLAAIAAAACFAIRDGKNA